MSNTRRIQATKEQHVVSSITHFGVQRRGQHARVLSVQLKLACACDDVLGCDRND